MTFLPFIDLHQRRYKKTRNNFCKTLMCFNIFYPLYLNTYNLIEFKIVFNSRIDLSNLEHVNPIRRYYPRGLK